MVGYAPIKTRSLTWTPTREKFLAIVTTPTKRVSVKAMSHKNSTLAMDANKKEGKMKQQKNIWSFLCETCDYGREYAHEHEANASAGMHRQDYPGHTTILHCGALADLRGDMVRSSA